MDEWRSRGRRRQRVNDVRSLDMNDRRRSPRTALRSDESIRLERRLRVHLLDISQSGALMTCEAWLPLDARGHLRTELAGQPFTTEVTVKRHHGREGAPAEVTVGAQFGAMDDRSRRHLEEFLRRVKD